MLKITKILICVLIAVIASSALFAYLKVTNDSDCFVSDQPHKLSTNTVEGELYSVYAVTSGFHEKSVAFHLFKEPVAFDNCGHPNDKPIDTASTEFKFGEQILTDINVLGTSQIELKISKEVTTNLEKIEVVWLPKDSANFMREAINFCEVHSTRYWQQNIGLEQLQALSPNEKIKLFRKQIQNTITSKEMNHIIFEKAASLPQDKYYTYLQAEISKLIGQPFNCPHIPLFYQSDASL